MTATNIFWRALTSLSDNLFVAIKISWIFPVGCALMSFGGGWDLLNFSSLADETVPPSSNEVGVMFLTFLAILIVIGLVFSMVATAWHRFVLLQEVPESILAIFSFSRGASYLGSFIKLILLVSLFCIPIFLAFGLIVGPMSLALMQSGELLRLVIINSLISLPLGAVITAIFYRYATVLPAIAIDQGITLRKAREATAGRTWNFIILGFYTSLFYTLLSIPVSILPIIGADYTSFEDLAAFQKARQSDAISVIYMSVTQWITSMLGISILSIIYDDHHTPVSNVFE